MVVAVLNNRIFQVTHNTLAIVEMPRTGLANLNGRELNRARIPKGRKYLHLPYKLPHSNVTDNHGFDLIFVKA